jgi:hypothetical protein
MTQRIWVVGLLLVALIGCNEDKAESCTSVCAEWGDPAAAFEDTVYQRNQAATADDFACNASSATPGSCPEGTRCVPQSSAWSAAGLVGPFCEVSGGPIVVDVREAEGAVDVTLALEFDGVPAGRAVRFRVSSDSGGRAVYYRTDPASSVADMRLAPGSYTLEFDPSGCGNGPFVHREARLQVLAAGRATLNVRTTVLRPRGEVEGRSVAFDSPCPSATNGFEGSECESADIIASVRVSSLRGASCSWSRRSPRVQQGEVLAQVSLDDEIGRIVGDLPPERLVVGERGSALDVSAEIARGEDMFAFEQGWGVLGATASPWLAGEFRGVTSWVRGEYGFSIILAQSGGFASLPFLSVPSQRFPPAEPLRFDEVPITVSASGSESREPFGLVAVYETGEEFYVWSDSGGDLRALMPTGVAALYFVPGARSSIDGPALLSPAWDTRDGEANFEIPVSALTIASPALAPGAEAIESYRATIEPSGFASWPALAREAWLRAGAGHDAAAGDSTTLSLPSGEWQVRVQARVDGRDAAWTGGALASTGNEAIALEVLQRDLAFDLLSEGSEVDAMRYIHVEERAADGADERLPADTRVWWRCDEDCPAGLERGEFLVVDRLAY